VLRVLASQPGRLRVREEEEEEEESLFKADAEDPSAQDFVLKS